MMYGDHRGPTTLSRYGVAGGAAVVLGGLLTWMILGAYHPLRPNLVCVEPLGNGQTAAYFGYTNERDEPVLAPVGDENWFEPGAADRKQPTAFPAKVAVGKKGEAFAVAFAGESLTWHLGGRKVEAYRESPRCVLPEKLEDRDVAWVKPKPPEPPKVEPPKPPEPEPPKPEEKPPEKPPEPPKLAVKAPRPKTDKPKPPPEVQKPPEPVPLALDGLTNLNSGIVVQSGEETSLGRPDVVATKENVKPQTGTPDGALDGTGDVEAPKRVAPKVKLRPKGEWPADAPPRAGAVLVKLSLLVGTDGRVKQVKVVKSAGAVFDREAKRVGLQAVFEPAKLGDEPVEQWVPWVVEFTPDEG